MSSAPTVARVTTLSQWSAFFHPVSGLFRLPRADGSTIEHLDIDLRYIDHDRGHAESDPSDGPPSKDMLQAQAQADDVSDQWAIPHVGDVYLPRVCVVTLRGAELVCDTEERMDCLAEVLLAINPMEVRWLNAASDPNEQLTFSTHLVHPAVIAAGEIWAKRGGARKLVIQGGFPCPNLSAPTPFSLTPAATPCASPGLKTSFGSVTSLSALTTLPALNPTKPRVVHVERLRARAERQRLADYTLKPRFEFAFGTWGSHVIEWRLDGRYSPACVVAIVENLLEAFSKTFPSPTSKDDLDLPSLITFAPLSAAVVGRIRELSDKLELENDIQSYLCDTAFFSITPDCESHARLWEGCDGDVKMTKEIQARQLKAEMLLLQHDTGIVPIHEMVPSLGGAGAGGGGGVTRPTSPEVSGSPMGSSTASIMPGETEASTEDEMVEAVTPDMGASVFLQVANDKQGGGDTVSDSSVFA